MCDNLPVLALRFAVCPQLIKNGTEVFAAQEIAVVFDEKRSREQRIAVRGVTDRWTMQDGYRVTEFPGGLGEWRKSEAPTAVDAKLIFLESRSEGRPAIRNTNFLSCTG